MTAYDLHIPTDLFIGGGWRPAEGNRRFAVTDPSNEALIAEVANATVADAIAAIDAAAEAAPAWAKTAPRERGEILRNAFRLINDRAESIADLISLENGKAFVDARSEIRYAAEFFRWFAEEAVRNLGELGIAPGGTNRMLVQSRPIGVSILVTPWNFPAAMAARKLAPALAAGCTCILKPADLTPLTALVMAELLTEAGVPDGVLNVVTTSNPGTVVSAMLADRRVRKLSFTGSTTVGRALLKVAADQVINCSMELGGNAPFIVFDDADLDKAIEGAMIAKMRNGGAACTAANRFYVQRSIAGRFTERLTARMKALTLGPPRNPHTQLGSLIDAKSQAKVARLVADARARGANILTGGELPAGPGFFYPPTVIGDVPPEAGILHEEIFGPVAPIMDFDTEEEAVTLANQTEYGLVAYVYTRDLARGLHVGEQIESGMIALNRGLVSDPAAPFGGMKQSGLGREGAHQGLTEFLEQQYVSTEW
jgi:succinate-semialdehyde dehydrogenase/glutarate-semialdehyde dehydrogenase